MTVAETSVDFVFPMVRFVDIADDAICLIHEENYLLYETDWTDGGEHNSALSALDFSTNNYHIVLTPTQND